MSGPEPSRRHLLRRVLLAFVSPESYGLVLLLIVASYVVAVSAIERWAPVVLFVQVATVWFALRTSRTSRPVRLVADGALVGAVVLALVQLLADGAGGEGLLFAASCVLYLVAPISILRHLILRQVVDQETVLGAVAAYLLIGMFFAFLYLFIGVVQGGPFFGSAGDGTLPQALFFSFTTLTTTGYGNLIPAENPGQTTAVAEMLIGQLFLITAVGKVITAWRPSRWSNVADRGDPNG